jgi:phosphatidylinositol alpha-1,6-mannosyltransferase
MTSRRPHVLFVAPNFGRMGGLEMYNFDAAKAMTRNGAEVLALSTFTSDGGQEEGIAVRGLLPKNRAARWLYRRIWRTCLNRYISSLPGSIDLIVAGHEMVLPTVAAVANRRHVPYWLCAFGIEIWKEWPPPLRAAILSAHHVIAISEFTAGTIRRRLPTRPEQVTVVYPMVDTSLFRPSEAGYEGIGSRVLTVGRLSAEERYKGHDLILQSLPHVMSDLGRTVSYWIVGDGDDRPRLESLASRLGVDDAVRFFGRRTGDPLVQLFRDCDVFAMPSWVDQRPDGTWTGEGFGIVYIEAAACGKPVIAANQGGAPEAVRDGLTGLLVEPDPEKVAQALVRLLSSWTLRQQMGSAGRQWAVERFSERSFDRHWFEILQLAGLEGG